MRPCSAYGVNVAEYERWLVSYHRGSEHIYQDEGSPPPLKQGDGVILPVEGYARFRVVDIWHSYDRHGILDVGTHVFLREVSDGEDDYPQVLFPHYFTPKNSDSEPQ